MFSIKDRVTIITGGTAGIGKATIKRFTKAGAKVVFAGRRDDGSELAAMTDSMFVQTDVAQKEQVKHLIDRTIDAYGRIDVMINNAGAGSDQNIENITEEDLDRVHAINTKGMLCGMKYSIPHMPQGGALSTAPQLLAESGSRDMAATHPPSLQLSV